MAPGSDLVWLFDIDGTLIRTDGAAQEAFSLAVREVLGIEDDLRGIAFAGRIEPQILGDILDRHRVAHDPALVERFWDAVIRHIATTLRPGRGRVLAGVHALLDVVEREPGWVPALLTGNMTRMAGAKLAHFGLDGRFAFGAFGEQAADRDQLARQAVAQAGARYGVPPRRCVVVGDTEHDVRCARAAGARVVAVATGTTARAVLAVAAPDLLLDHLGDTAAVVSWARGLVSDGIASA
jgi:phosphoglycolate phosphatase-like HAD superfamily hydrolase